jgi:hypothetical protein
VLATERDFKGSVIVVVKNDQGRVGDVERHTVLDESEINFTPRTYFLPASPANEHCFGLYVVLPSPSVTVRTKGFECQRSTALCV